MSRLLPLFGFLLLVALFGFGIWWNTGHDPHDIASPLIDQPDPPSRCPCLASRSVWSTRRRCSASRIC